MTTNTEPKNNNIITTNNHCEKVCIPLKFNSSYSVYNYLINKDYNNGYILKKIVKENINASPVCKDTINNFTMYIENKDDLLEFLECYIDIEVQLYEDVSFIIGYDEIMYLRDFSDIIKHNVIRLVNLIGKLYKDNKPLDQELQKEVQELDELRILEQEREKQQTQELDELQREIQQLDEHKAREQQELQLVDLNELRLKAQQELKEQHQQQQQQKQQELEELQREIQELDEHKAREQQELKEQHQQQQQELQQQELDELQKRNSTTRQHKAREQQELQTRVKDNVTRWRMIRKGMTTVK